MGKTTIDRRWLPLNALRAFEGVAKHASFTAAANALPKEGRCVERSPVLIAPVVAKAPPATNPAAQKSRRLMVSFRSPTAGRAASTRAEKPSSLSGAADKSAR